MYLVILTYFYSLLIGGLCCEGFLDHGNIDVADPATHSDMFEMLSDVTQCMDFCLIFPATDCSYVTFKQSTFACMLFKDTLDLATDVVSADSNIIEFRERVPCSLLGSTTSGVDETTSGTSETTSGIDEMTSSIDENTSGIDETTSGLVTTQSEAETTTIENLQTAPTLSKRSTSSCAASDNIRCAFYQVSAPPTTVSSPENELERKLVRTNSECALLCLEASLCMSYFVNVDDNECIMFASSLPDALRIQPWVYFRMV